jgi:hypothetical protein
LPTESIIRPAVQNKRSLVFSAGRGTAAGSALERCRKNRSSDGCASRLDLAGYAAEIGREVSRKPSSSTLLVAEMAPSKFGKLHARTLAEPGRFLKALVSELHRASKKYGVTPDYLIVDVNRRDLT